MTAWRRSPRQVRERPFAVGEAGCADVEHWDGISWRRVPVPPRTVLTQPPDALANPSCTSRTASKW
jgi:hypothetical protein